MFIGKNILCQWIIMSRAKNPSRSIQELALYQQEGTLLWIDQRKLSPFEVGHQMVMEAFDEGAYMRDYQFDNNEEKLSGIHFRNL